MAYSVNWITKVITIPLSDLMLVSGVNYSLNVDYAHDEIRRLEWEFADGLWADHAIEYINSYLLSGLVYSPVIQMVNGYTWFIDTTDINVSLIGSNSNFLDTFIPGNGVSVLANNSAGKIYEEGSGGGGTDPASVWAHVLSTGFTADKELTDARIAAEASEIASNDAELAADGAKTAAESADASAVTAAQNASQAKTSADTAANVAGQAKSSADAALAEATLAKEAAESAEAAVLLLENPDNASIQKIIEAHFNKRHWDKVGKTITIYDVDNITPLHVFDTNDDLSEITPQ